MVIGLILLHMFLGIFTWWFLRGGGIESSLLNYRNVPHLKPLAALIFGIDFAYFCNDLGYIENLPYPDIWQAVICGLLMWLGSTPKWGRYIGAMAGNPTIGETKMWGLKMMTLRGMFLGFCVGLSWFVGAPLWFSLSSLVVGALMGPIYYWAFNYVTANSKVFNPWTIAEMVFGVVFWVPLTLLAITAKNRKKGLDKTDES